jgi:hypothetical protein
MIDHRQVERAAEAYGNTAYGNYLRALIGGDNRYISK